jgi:hypothetical protein
MLHTARRTTLILGALAAIVVLRATAVAQIPPIERPTPEARQNFTEFGRFVTSLQREGRLAPIPEMFEMYRVHLVEAGESAVAADARVSTFERWVTDPRALRWNIALTSGTRVNREPNRFLARMLERLEPGRALDVGMGQGRNATYLAQQGWHVTGVDPAIFAVEVARERAAEIGVTLNTVVLGRKTSPGARASGTSSSSATPTWPPSWTKPAGRFARAA